MSTDPDPDLFDDSNPPDQRELLAFYDRLRERITKAVSNPKSELSKSTAELLMTVPDVFMLLVRMALDREVPATSRKLIGAALVYFVVPLDLMPELVLGPGGFIDDVVLAAAVLSHALGDQLEPLAARHWSGSGKVREVLRDLATSANSLLGDRVFRRLRRLLGMKGVRL